MPDVFTTRGTLNITQAQRAVDMRAAILELEPDATPLCQLTMGKQNSIGSRATHNPKFDWVESRSESRFDAIDNGAVGTGAFQTVDTGTKFGEHDLWKNTRTGELMRVLAVVGNVVEFVRGIRDAAVATLNNDELMKVGSAYPEGDDVQTPRSKNPTVVSNCTEIFRKSWGSTETLIHSDTYTTPTDWAHAGARAGFEHKRDIEGAFWHGKAAENTAGTQPLRTTGGVFQYITSNVTDVGGAMTETEFFGAFRGAFRYGNKRVKTLFCSQLFADIINTYPRSKINAIQSDNDNTYGLAVTRFVSPQGTLNVVINYPFEGSVYSGYGVILDMSQITRRPLSNAEGSRDTQILPNRQGNGVDGRLPEYLSEVGLEFGLEESHAIVSNATSAA